MQGLALSTSSGIVAKAATHRGNTAMRTITSAVLRTFCLIFLVFPGLSFSQQKTIVELQTEIVSPWLVTVEGEERTRTLRITKTVRKSDDALLLEAVYGWTDGNQTSISASIVQSGQDVHLLFTTQPGSKVATVQTPSGTFEGTFTATNGAVKQVKVEKVSDGGIQAKATSLNARAAGVFVYPSSDVPKECAAFFGRWTGRWQHYGQTWLWVVEVGANCVAKCMNWTTSAVPTTFQSCEIKNNVLVREKSDGAEYYDLHGDELWARYEFSGGQTTTVFKKLKPGEK